MIRILTTLYNSKNYISTTINSLKQQEIKDFKVYITDDVSTDDSIKEAKHYISGDKRFQLIENKEKFYQCGNYWQVHQLEEISDNDICVTVDGDDWLPDNHVLDRVLEAYKDDNTWLTYGQFIHWKGPNQFFAGFAAPPDWNNLRKCRWTTTHLRTWKAGLFRKIDKGDLTFENGDWIRTAGDLAFMYPMLEMASESHCKFLEDVNYVYNVHTPLNEFKTNMQDATDTANMLRNKPSYEKIESYV